MLKSRAKILPFSARANPAGKRIFRRANRRLHTSGVSTQYRPSANHDRFPPANEAENAPTAPIVRPCEWAKRIMPPGVTRRCSGSIKCARQRQIRSELSYYIPVYYGVAGANCNKVSVHSSFLRSIPEPNAAAWEISIRKSNLRPLHFLRSPQHFAPRAAQTQPR